MRVRAILGVAMLAAWVSLAAAGPVQAATFTRDVGTTQSFSNATEIDIADGYCDFDNESGEQGLADPYPSPITVSGMTGSITDVNVTLHGLSHVYLQDLRALLVGPQGQKVLFLHGAGDGEVDDVTFKFDDAWDDEALHDSGSVAPSFGDLGCDFIGEQDSLPAPAPASPYATALAAFNTTNPNGEWRLYMVDMFGDETGVVADGWSVEITTGITINDGECYDGPEEQVAASEYPSSIPVAGLPGNVTDVNLTLKNYSHQIPGDVRMLLVGPAGQKVLVMHHAGTVTDVRDGNEVEDLTLVLDDAAATTIPAPIAASGTYKPTQIDDEEHSQICGEFLATTPLPAPAPATPYGSALSAFNGTNPNGTWKLYIVDDFGDAAGSLDGWALDITTDYVSYFDRVQANHPVGYWRFGEPSGTFLTDSSGNGRHGTYIGGVTLGTPGALAPLDTNTAGTWDGVNDQGRVPDHPTMDVGNTFTVEGWIRRSSDAKTHELMNKGGSGIHLVVQSAAAGNKVLLRRANVASIADSTVGVPADGAYHHVVATMNGLGSTARIYIDGVDRTHTVSPGQTILDTTFPMTFGSFGAAAPVSPADFDEFALYDSALSAADVAAHYAAGHPAM
jgi:subtilisin-like proprotein convertase family protein